MQPIALCWDIDGTLLTTARAGVYALEAATLEVTGRPLDLQAMRTAGLTDVEIAHAVLQHHSSSVGDAELARFLEIYERELPASLNRRRGEIMPGVTDILDDLARRESWISILLTGNTARGARAKLEHYGLAHYFSEGAFSDGTKNRAEIAHRARNLVTNKTPVVSPGRIVVIGDTPYDIRCARAAGLRCIAVATGGYTEQELTSYRPDAVLPRLPAPAEFEQILEEVCRRVSYTAGPFIA